MKNLLRRVSRLESYCGSKLRAEAQQPVIVISTEEMERAVDEFGRSRFRDDAMGMQTFRQQTVEHILAAGNLSQLSDEELAAVEHILVSASPATGTESAATFVFTGARG
jgi:hypothetical protein